MAIFDNSEYRFNPSINPSDMLFGEVGSTSTPEPSKKISDGPPFFVTTGANPVAAASRGAKPKGSYKEVSANTEPRCAKYRYVAANSSCDPILRK